MGVCLYCCCVVYMWSGYVPTTYHVTIHNPVYYVLPVSYVDVCIDYNIFHKITSKDHAAKKLPYFAYVYLSWHSSSRYCYFFFYFKRYVHIDTLYTYTLIHLQVRICNHMVTYLSLFSNKLLIIWWEQFIASLLRTESKFSTINFDRYLFLDYVLQEIAAAFRTLASLNDVSPQKDWNFYFLT